jgi:hypothetical protein
LETLGRREDLAGHGFTLPRRPEARRP